MAESVATLARCPRGTASSAEKEQLEELGRAESTPDSRFRAAARISARSAMEGTDASAGRAASRRALRRDAGTGVEEERARLADATVGGGTAEPGEETTTATTAAGEAGEVGWASEATSGGERGDKLQGGARRFPRGRGHRGGIFEGWGTAVPTREDRRGRHWGGRRLRAHQRGALNGVGGRRAG